MSVTIAGAATTPATTLADALGTGFSAIIVVYNERLAELPILRRLLTEPAVRQIVICDNSTQANDNSHVASELGVTYLDMHGNAGLSRAYNRAVAVATEDVICVFDDDSTIGEGYYRELAAVVRDDQGWDVMLPLVKCGEDILSPCRFSGYRAHPFVSVDHIDASDARLSGINSGMAIRRRAFERVRYDERLFLDLVDHRFCADVRAAGLRIGFCPGMELSQSYSLGTDDVGAALSRFRIFSKDARAFYSPTLPQRVYCAVMLLRRRLMLALRYRTSAFLRDREEASGPGGGTGVRLSDTGDAAHVMSADVGLGRKADMSEARRGGERS